MDDTETDARRGQPAGPDRDPVIDPARRDSTGQIDVVPRSAGLGSDGRDVVDVLLAQHEHIKRTFAQVSSSTPAQKAKSFTGLCDLLRMHEIAEQQIVHPVTARVAGGGQQTADARGEEEEHAAQTMSELSALGVDHPGFDEAFAAFHQAVLAHAEHEEQEEFPRLRRDVPAEQLAEMATAVLTVQNERIAPAHTDPS